MALSEISGCELLCAGACVTGSEIIRKGWKIRNIWKWDHEEWELYSRSAPYIFLNRRLTDIWKMETCATDSRLTGIYGQCEVWLASLPALLLLIPTLTHPPSELNWISYKTFWNCYVQKRRVVVFKIWLFWIEIRKSNLWHFKHFLLMLVKKEKKNKERQKKIVPVQREKRDELRIVLYRVFIERVESKSQWIL